MKQEKKLFALLEQSYEIIEKCKNDMLNSPDEIHYELVNFETGPKMARECLDNGFEVILCHGGTGDTIFRSVPHSVVKIERCAWQNSILTRLFWHHTKTNFTIP